MAGPGPIGRGGLLRLKRSYRDIIIGNRPEVRLVYLEGSRELIRERLAARKGHFMPPGLLDSQFKTLEPPETAENPVTVSIDASVEAIVDDIVRQLGLESPNSGKSSRKRA